MAFTKRSAEAILSTSRSDTVSDAIDVAGLVGAVGLGGEKGQDMSATCAFFLESIVNQLDEVMIGIKECGRLWVKAA